MKSRASLPVRVALIVLAVLALVAAGLAGANLVTVGRFNQATATLTRNIKAIAKEDADLSTLKASQQQTDAQFEDAAALRAVLLPSIRASLETNTEVSHRLTELIEQRLAEQQGGGSSGSGGASDDATGAATDNQRNNRQSDGSGLTDAQKAQVEQLLKSNQQSTDTSESTRQDADQKSKQNQTTKPW
ncbi:cell surface protein [Bifidobacterium sp. MA2]|uniref:Cell surface protein n=1 Tax=Bifidobacterium santillanense TaxID=2809028 RepID=A0ABS5UN32_9BIFI|nr:DUF6466 family protein [Bifidobacterium santillanense]MBT1172289.1 cell surface protein [Bifidobacterium santillanense]